MSAHTVDKLVYMANQIARNLAQEADPVGVMTKHIHDFWSPRMRQQIFAHGDAGLDPVARDALARLAQSAHAG